MSLVKAAVFAAAFSLCAPAVMAEEATQHAQSVTSAPEATLQGRRLRVSRPKARCRPQRYTFEGMDFDLTN
jgi:hypothetical protein